MKKELEIEKIYSLSPMQEGMLFYYLKDEKSTAYSEQRFFTLEGEIDPALLENSIRYLVERYDVFRTVFRYQKVKQPLQIVFKNRKFNLHFEDISQMPEPAQEKYLEDIKNNDRQKGFDFRKDLLIRVFLFKTGIDTWKLLWSFHHIIMDGWCLGIIFKELNQVYNALRQGKPVQLKPAVPFREYIRWLKKQDPDKGLLYWQEYLAGYQWQASLAGPRNHKERGEYQLKEYAFIIPGNLKERMNRLAVEEQSTLFTLLQTAWGILLQKYNNTDDVVFGTVVSGRSPGIEGIGDMVGLFVNTIPLRVQTKEKQDFKQLLKQVHQEILSTRSYEHLPLAEVQARSLLKGRLIDHIIVYENYPFPGDTGQNHTGKDPGFRVIHMESHEQTSYDLNILGIPGKELTIVFNYNASVYENDFLEKTANRFLNLLNEVTENPNREISKIEITSAEEKKQLLLKFNETRREYPRDKTIHALFAEQVQQTPDHIAVVGVHETSSLEGTGGLAPLSSEGTGSLAPLSVLMSITYKELNRKANQLMEALKEKGVLANDFAAIMVERSIEMIIGILGILKAGGAYLPIDPNYPEERIEYMLKDSSAQILLKDNDFTPEAFNNSPKGALSFGIWDLEFGISLLQGGQLAYILYTSGTTGWPRGVMVEHRNVVRLVKNTNYIRFQLGQRLLQTGPLEFDASTFEIWGPLLNGGILCEIPRQELLMPQTLGMRIQCFGIDTMWMTAPLFNQMVDADIKIFTGIKNLLVGGDILSPPHIDRIKQWFPQMNVINGYGPTENTTFSTTFLIDRKYKKNIPIGKPITNSTVYILDRNFQLQPVGVVGELVVGGDGVSRGYLNDPQLTLERFTNFNQKLLRGVQGGDFLEKSPPGRRRQKIYRTGDLARWLHDGNIEFLGRRDHQVKIRGVRIELGEIENHLKNHEEIEEAVVLVKENEAADKYLWAYIVSDRTFNVSQLKEYLSTRLPGNMVPSIFVQIDKIPLTANGKVDRKLLDLQGRRIITGIEYAAPQNETEKIIANIWKQILNVDKVGRHDNFFDLGGDSLKVVRLNMQLNEALNIDVPVAKLFNYVTIHSFIRYLTREKDEEILSDGEGDRVGAREKAKQLRKKQKSTRKKIERIDI